MTYNDSADSVIFREVQRFTQIWVWIIILLAISPAWYGFIEQLVYGNPFGSNPASDQEVLVSWVLAGVLLPLFIFSIRLTVEIRNSGIYVKLFPFHLSFKHYPFENIRSYDSITYRPLRDYGGWGLRYGSKGKAYNIKGNKGLLLEFTDGGRLMIGSQEPEVLKMSVDQGLNRK